MELEHKAHGIEFGTGFGQRLDWLDESVGAMRRVLDGGSVTSEPGGRYAFDDLRHAPRPVQAHLPIMIGGGGEKKTLRTVARYADMWNGMGPVDVVADKLDVLRGHCDDVGRDFGDRADARGQGHDPRHRSRGEPCLASGDGTQPGRRWPASRTTRPSGMGRRNSWPTGCGPMWNSDFGP